MEITNSATLGRVIRFHRKKSRLTQLALADLAGIGKTAVFDIEKGKETIKLKTLFKILAVLNIKLSGSSPIMNEFRGENEAS